MGSSPPSTTLALRYYRGPSPQLTAASGGAKDTSMYRLQCTALA